MRCMSKADVLIAEDDAVLRNLYLKKFAVAGFTIRTAEDGEQALAELQNHPPDIAVLDIHMPKMDGFQVLEHFPPATRSFPIIMLSNFGDEKSKLQGRQLGADDYFVKKDMTIKSLLEMVERVLVAWRSTHQA